MTKRWVLILLIAICVLSVARAAFAAADWDDDDDAPRSAKAASRVRTYQGGADEQDLKVQAALPASGRYPDSPAHPEKSKAVDDDGNPIDD